MLFLFNSLCNLYSNLTYIQDLLTKVGIQTPFPNPQIPEHLLNVILNLLKLVLCTS